MAALTLREQLVTSLTLSLPALPIQVALPQPCQALQSRGCQPRLLPRLQEPSWQQVGGSSGAAYLLLGCSERLPCLQTLTRLRQWMEGALSEVRDTRVGSSSRDPAGLLALLQAQHRCQTCKSRPRQQSRPELHRLWPHLHARWMVWWRPSAVTTTFLRLWKQKPHG